MESRDPQRISCTCSTPPGPVASAPRHPRLGCPSSASPIIDWVARPVPRPSSLHITAPKPATITVPVPKLAPRLPNNQYITMEKVKPGRKAKPKPPARPKVVQNTSAPPEKTPAKKGKRGAAKLKIEKGDQAHLAKSKEKTTNQLAKHLKDHLLGTYRMSSSCLTFHWKGENSDQRRVREDHVENMVQNFQDEGLKRLLPANYISAIINRQSWEEAIDSLQNSSGVDPFRIEDDEEEDLGTPYLILPAGVTVEAQSGQHRIHALRQLFTDEADRWWVVKLYDDCISTQGKEHLRDNNQDLHLVPSLAENWSSIISYQRNNDDLQVSRTLATIGKSGPKIKQLLGSEHLRDQITAVLRNRGHWPQFTAGRLSRLLPLRCHEELSNYLRRIDMTWEFMGGELGEGFLKLIDNGTVKALEGRAPGRYIEDAQFVVDNMEEHRLFFKVTNQEDRNKILQRLLQIDYRILSLHTFWEDNKHLESFSRVMTDVASWLDPSFSSSKASFKQTFARCLNPEKKYGSKTYPQFWISQNSLRERKKREVKRRYHAQTYTDIWTYIFKNVYALYTVYPKSYAPDVPREEWATASPLPIVPGMKEEQVELYNNRFSIVEWRFLYDAMEKIGYDFEESSSMGIGPKNLKLPPREASTAESRAEDFQHKIFKEALERTRPYLGKELSTTVLTKLLSTLPPITADDLEDFRLRAPRTEAPLERFGGIAHVWTPGFTECYDMLERSVIYKNVPSDTNKPPIEKDQVSMTLFVKRDIIWSYFQHPVRGNMYKPREGQWPPRSQDNKIDLDDDENGEGCAMDAYGYDSGDDKGDDDSENSFHGESGDGVSERSGEDDDDGIYDNLTDDADGHDSRGEHAMGEDSLCAEKSVRSDEGNSGTEPVGAKLKAGWPSDILDENAPPSGVPRAETTSRRSAPDPIPNMVEVAGAAPHTATPTTTVSPPSPVNAPDYAISATARVSTVSARVSTVSAPGSTGSASNPTNTPTTSARSSQTTSVARASTVPKPVSKRAPATTKGAVTVAAYSSQRPHTTRDEEDEVVNGARRQPHRKQKLSVETPLSQDEEVEYTLPAPAPGLVDVIPTKNVAATRKKRSIPDGGPSGTSKKNKKYKASWPRSNSTVNSEITAALGTSEAILEAVTRKGRKTYSTDDSDSIIE